MWEYRVYLQHDCMFILGCSILNKASKQYRIRYKIATNIIIQYVNRKITVFVNHLYYSNIPIWYPYSNQRRFGKCEKEYCLFKQKKTICENGY